MVSRCWVSGISFGRTHGCASHTPFLQRKPWGQLKRTPGIIVVNTYPSGTEGKSVKQMGPAPSPVLKDGVDWLFRGARQKRSSTSFPKYFRAAASGNFSAGTSGSCGHLDFLTLGFCWYLSLVVLRRHVCPDAATAEGPDRLGPAPGAARSAPLEAAAGAALGRGTHHWAHFLLRVLPSACGLGPVTPGELQEAGMKGAALPSPCD